MGKPCVTSETIEPAPGTEETPPPPPATDAGNAAAQAAPVAPGATGGRVETLERLAALRSSGAITDEEFAAEKAHVMNNST